MKRPLVSYLPYMFRDYLITRGAAMAITSLVFVVPAMMTFRAMKLTPERMRIEVFSMLGSMTVFVALVAVYGLLGQDFRLGYSRALFSKPISVTGYYSGLIVCALLSYLLVVGLVLGGFAAIGVDVWAPGPLVDLVFKFALLGSTVLLFSRITRLDWIVGVFVYTMAGPLRQVTAEGGAFRRLLVDVVMPPTHLLSIPPPARQAGQISALLPAGGADWSAMAWVGGYAAFMVLVGVTLTRVVPLGGGD
jgi:hypothetical protein